VVCERCGEHFEPGDEFCRHCSQPEPPTSGGCVYCREVEPILCEGFCVHCGREVLPGRAGLTASATSTESEDLEHRHDGGIESKLTYGESLSVAWLLIWRGSIIVAAVGFVAGSLVWVSATRGGAAIEGLGVALIFLPTLLLGVFIVMPWLVRTMVQKRYRGFSVFVYRVGSPHRHSRATRTSEP
jgi:uncharacterized OB-fold protein